MGKVPQCQKHNVKRSVLENAGGLKMAKGNEKQPNAGRQPPKVIRVMQDFALSGLAASLSHIPHHPLYTLKSQMMFYGKGFNIKQFVITSFERRGTFLMRGEELIIYQC